MTPLWFIILGVAWYFVKDRAILDDTHTEIPA